MRGVNQVIWKINIRFVLW